MKAEPTLLTYGPTATVDPVCGIPGAYRKRVPLTLFLDTQSSTSYTPSQ